MYYAKNPNVIDNSAKIAQVQKEIAELRAKKNDCYKCRGTQTADGGLCGFCKGTGIIKMGYYTPQYYPCSYCGQTGRKKVRCDLCMQTDNLISYYEIKLNTLNDTQGLTRYAADLYYDHQATVNRINNECQMTINNIADSHLEGTYKSSSASAGGCSICRGTGMEPTAWDSESASRSPNAGGYTNPSGTKCPYCGLYKWHQHKYCPGCNADKCR